MEHALKELFGLREVKAEAYSPLALAYIGDCAYELTVRTILLHKGNAPVDKLNARASRLAKAGTQARMIVEILGNLSEEEQTVYRRGRNAKSYTVAKNATVSEYRRATGFEALLGWLYLKGDYGRMAEIIRMGFQAIDAEILNGMEQGIHAQPMPCGQEEEGKACRGADAVQEEEGKACRGADAVQEEEEEA